MKNDLLESLAVSVLVLGIGTVGLAATIHVPADRPTIQGAIDAAADGDTVLVAPGTYYENIAFKGKAITVTSSAGADVTIIDGGGPFASHATVHFGEGEGPDSVLNGFTVTRGQPGIWCQSSPTITENVIADNEAPWGGGIYIPEGAPTITGNVISGNLAYDSHSGMISGGFGGGIYCLGSAAVISGNVISQNAADLSGGGVCCSSNTTLSDNTIASNSAHWGGGIMSWLHPEGAVSITNSILWDNTAVYGPQIAFESSSPAIAAVSFSDVQGGLAQVYLDGSGLTLTWEPGNIVADPLFVDAANGDHHLSWRSPCINRGTNEGVSGNDIDGDPRIFMGTVDMGADEFTGVHPLAADAFSVSELSGGNIHFKLQGGKANAGRPYLMLGSVTGTAPGTLLPDGLDTLPLNWDAFTTAVYVAGNTQELQRFVGTLHGNGQAGAKLHLPPVPGLAGLTMHYGYCLSGGPYDFASNPVAVEIVH